MATAKNTKTPIEGLKLIYFTGGINIADDPSYPFKLDINLSPPELMEIAFVMLHGGSEEIVLRAMTLEAINKFIELNDIKRHPRLRRIIITGPDGLKEEFTRGST